MPGLLLVNPRSGSGPPDGEELAEEARRRGIDVRVLGPGEDAAELARAADAEALGIAGGDGSLGPIAEVALERGLPFVCVPFGTRNHFARDLGLDRDDPVAALDAFSAGAERRIDVGRAGERIFLNNVSLGMYARLVHRRERRRRRREALARAHALWLTLRSPRAQRVTVDGEPLVARVILVANNDYELGLLSLGERERLDAGELHLYAAHGIVRSTWEERTAERFVIDTPTHRVRAAVDGEPAELETPLELRVEPLALRVLVPNELP
jgi:diacylglycerol kinase family enzyme